MKNKFRLKKRYIGIVLLFSIYISIYTGYWFKILEYGVNSVNYSIRFVKIAMYDVSRFTGFYKIKYNKDKKFVYTLKGFDNMIDSVMPELIEGHCFNAMQINRENSFACVAWNGYAIGSIDDNLKMNFNFIKEGFPDQGVLNFFADENCSVMCGTSGYVGFEAISVETKKTISIVPGFVDEGKELHSICQTELKGNIVLLKIFKVGHAEGKDEGYILYDIENSKEFFRPTLPLKDPLVFSSYHIEKSLYLISNYNAANNSLTYYFATLTDTGFVNKSENELTKVLSKGNFSLFKRNNENNPFNFKQNMIIGRFEEPQGTTTPVIVRWEAGFKDVKIEPLIYQVSSDYILYEGTWTFSIDGKWLVNTAEKSERARIAFFHVDPKYPQGISPMILGGFGDSDNGCFVNHSKFGMLFLDFGTEKNVTVVYKMNDCLPLIAEKMRSLIK